MSQMACLWFCSMIFYKFYKSHQKSKVSVFDFVAWFFTSFTSQSKMSQMACLWFCSMIFYKFYKSVQDVPNGLSLIL